MAQCNNKYCYFSFLLLSLLLRNAANNNTYIDQFYVYQRKKKEMREIKYRKNIRLNDLLTFDFQFATKCLNFQRVSIDAQSKYCITVQNICLPQFCFLSLEPNIFTVNASRSVDRQEKKKHRTTTACKATFTQCRRILL